MKSNFAHAEKLNVEKLVRKLSTITKPFDPTQMITKVKRRGMWDRVEEEGGG